MMRHSCIRAAQKRCFFRRAGGFAQGKCYGNRARNREVTEGTCTKVLNFLHPEGIKKTSMATEKNLTKNWLAPLCVIGLSALGLAFASERGRERMSALLERLGRNGDPVGEVNKFFDQQLDAIQRALDRVANSLQAEEEQEV